MENANFYAAADAWLAEFLDAVEAADADGALEADLIEGVLTVRLPDGRVWVVNKHAPTGQMWMASPISGAWRFSYDAVSGAWTGGKSGTLREKLADELEEAAGVKLPRGGSRFLG